MPRPGHKPPTKSVDDRKTVLLKQMWDKYNKEGSKTINELHSRDTKMISELIELLAISQLKNEFYENENI